MIHCYIGFFQQFYFFVTPFTDQVRKIGVVVVFVIGNISFLAIDGYKFLGFMLFLLLYENN